MKQLSREELALFLIEKADQYAKYSFVQDDPIQIPHSFSTEEDIEISGLIAATLSWGNRKTIIAKSNDLMDRMDRSPAEFYSWRERVRSRNIQWVCAPYVPIRRHQRTRS